MAVLAGYLERLNPEQREAVEHFEGPILVLAGAGSGKTRVLTTRIAHLIHEHGVDPAAILAVTFTNKAAGEMRERVRRLLGEAPAGMWVGTFHSIGARLLRRHAASLGWSSNFSILDADQALRETRRAMERRNVSIRQWNPQAVHGAISAAKNQLISPETYAELAGDAFSRVVAGVYPTYNIALRDQNSLDFDDLLVKPVELFEGQPTILERYRERFQFVLVDEYQDTNRAQYRFVQLLASEHGNLMVVGDDDQSIYGWRGADIRNILDFEKDFSPARVVRLEQNYRSTGHILEAANHIIAENKRRKGKTLRTDAGPGELLTLVEAADERDEADWIADEIESRSDRRTSRKARDFVVLYRTNAQSRALEEAFRRQDLPYQVVGGTLFYERREIMDVLAYLRLISNPKDAGAFDRIVNLPRRGIGDTTKARLFEWAAARGLAPLEAAASAEECEQLRGGLALALAKFAGMIQRFAGLASRLNVGELLEKLIEEIALLDALKNEGPEGLERIENVRELVAGAHDFDERRDALDAEDASQAATPLDLFLQKVSLITDIDRHDPLVDAVTLMTLHNAKGLEFPVVFISGLEDGLFPLVRVFDEPADLEEERRLFYVGITRAEEKIYLTHARMRRRAGDVVPCKLSSFMKPMPERLLERRVTTVLARTRAAQGTGWRGRSISAGAGSLGFRDGSGAGVDADEYIDDFETQDSPRFVKGERVLHPQFGSGTIRELSGLGRELKATIDFDTAGRKRVVVRYANLQKEL